MTPSPGKAANAVSDCGIFGRLPWALRGANCQMETSLHRDLKRLYAGADARVEIRLAGYRIDAVVGDELIEIQHGPLAAIRDKVRRLLTTHHVRVVKPIVAKKQLVVRSRPGGRVARRRASPKHGRLLDLFDELIHFTNVFPHPRLTLEVPLVSVEEWRCARPRPPPLAPTERSGGRRSKAGGHRIAASDFDAFRSRGPRRLPAADAISHRPHRHGPRRSPLVRPADRLLPAANGRDGNGRQAA